MDDMKIKIIKCARKLFGKSSFGDISFDDIARELDISKEVIYTYFESKPILVESILEHERNTFNKIFDEYDFEDQNAIDILLIVSKEISQSYEILNPLLSIELKKFYPEVYERQFNKKRDFIFEKIKINIDKGINQGYYRNDLSIELIARLYILKLMDIHDPENFIPDDLSFEKFFDLMFESLIRGIANPKGIEYYEQRKKLYKL
jgi:TetR/AcrR family transcriptional regulator, cholesterol catabolism regulator